MKEIKRTFPLEIRSVNEEERTAEFVITDEAHVDTYRTVFKADGAVLERYNSNPLVTYQHEDWSKDPDMILGTSELKREESKWVAVVRFEDLENDLNEVAEKVWRKVKKGTLRMASILARGIEGSFGVSELNEDPDVFYFRKWELYSWSVVTHGSNPGAVKRSTEEVDWIDSLKNENKEVSFDQFDARFLTLKYK